MSLLDELTSIRDAVFADPKNVHVDVRQRFWRIVGQIKRMDNPDEKLISKVTAVRDCLYEQRLGRPKSLKLLVLWFIAGTVGLIYYLWMVWTGLQHTGNMFRDLLFAKSAWTVDVGAPLDLGQLSTSVRHLRIMPICAYMMGWEGLPHSSSTIAARKSKLKQSNAQSQVEKLSRCMSPKGDAEEDSDGFVLRVFELLGFL